MPAIIHGPYQCGKTSLLFAMSEDLAGRGYEVFFVDFEEAIQSEGFTRDIFYKEISLQVFKKRMGEEQFRSHLEYRSGVKKKPFILIDEMQCMDASNEVERTVRGFCKFLDTNGVPWIAAGTSELRELAWRKQNSKPLDTEPGALGSRFN